MALPVSLILVAAGAILIWAVTSGVNIHAVGWILFVVGIVGGLISLVLWSTWPGPGYPSRRRRTVVEEHTAD